MRTASRFLPFAGILFFGCAALAALRLAAADTFSRQDSAEAINSAIRLEWPMPSSERELALAEIDLPHRREHLQRAAELNPRSTAVWIALGLLEETNRDFLDAERSLNRAARVDHQYLPAWTLANFYFRQADREKFWNWADRAASLAYDDFQPLLDLCDRLETDPARLLAHFHNLRRLRPHYLDVLIGKNRLDAAQQVAREMLGEKANAPYVLDLADRQLRAGNAADAMELWNAASGFPAIEPSAGRILTNGDLGRVPSNLGFDWRLGQAEGLAGKWRPSELIFTLSGSQPETCVLLEQSIVLVPGHARLRFEYTTAIAGVHWLLDSAEGASIQPHFEWTEGTFDLPRAHGLQKLRLFYRRKLGTVRAEGRFEIRNLRLETL